MSKKPSNRALFLSFILALVILFTIAALLLLSRELFSLQSEPLSILASQLLRQEATAQEKQDLISAFVSGFDSDSQISVGVAENPVNRLVAQLKNKELALVEKERLIEQEAELLNRRKRNEALMEDVLIVGIVILAGLIGVVLLEN